MFGDGNCNNLPNSRPIFLCIRIGESCGWRKGGNRVEKCKVWLTLSLLRNLKWDIPSSSRCWLRIIDRSEVDACSSFSLMMSKSISAFHLLRIHENYYQASPQTLIFKNQVSQICFLIHYFLLKFVLVFYLSKNLFLVIYIFFNILILWM